MRKLITDFDNVTKMDIGPLAQKCLVNLAANPRYPDAKLPAAALLAALTPYQAAAAIQYPTPTQTAELAHLRTALNQALAAVAAMANAQYPADEAALLSTGLALSPELEHHTSQEAPTNLQLAS